LSVESRNGDESVAMCGEWYTLGASSQMEISSGTQDTVGNIYYIVFYNCHCISIPNQQEMRWCS
jgi:hypothetical protein